MVVAVGIELELVLDPAEELRRRMEDEAVAAECEVVAETGAAVGVGSGTGDGVVAPQQLDGDIDGGRAAGRVEHVGRE